MIRKYLTLLILLSCLLQYAQVTITNYSVNSIGQAQLSIQGQAGKYYLLHAQHSPSFNWVTSLTVGISGTMVISEPALPILSKLQHYRTRHFQSRRLGRRRH